MIDVSFSDFYEVSPFEIGHPSLFLFIRWSTDLTQEWAPLNSGVPQDSVLGPVLFIIYINDVDVGINNLISKLADDTKMGYSVLTDKNKQNFKEDLYKISAWSDRWEMPFNVNKYQVLEVGTRNKKFDYEMRGVKLKSVQCGKDLGVEIASNLKFS